MGMPNDVLEQMQKQGIGKNVEEMDGPAFAGKVNPGGIGGNASIGWYNNAPHPNAAKVFVNWYLSAEFQRQYAEIVQVNSRRTEVKPADEKHALNPALSYFNTSEENIVLVKELQARVKTWGVLGNLGNKKK
jgi:iron(III) transport system substrate-binding protein